MTRSNDEDPLERLRAADPAAGGAAPDRDRIRAAVDRRLAGTGAAGAAEPAGSDPGSSAAADHHGAGEQHGGGERHGADELTARRRRRQPLRYAAAAVGAVLLLGGGYTLGAGSGGSTLSA